MSPIYWLWCYSPGTLEGTAHWETVWFNLQSRWAKPDFDIVVPCRNPSTNQLRHWKSWARKVNLHSWPCNPLISMASMAKSLLDNSSWCVSWRGSGTRMSFDQFLVPNWDLRNLVGMRPKVGIGSSVSSLVSLVIAGMFTWDFKSTKIHCRKRTSWRQSTAPVVQTARIPHPSWRLSEPTPYLFCTPVESAAFYCRLTSPGWAHNTGHLADHHRKSHQMTIQKPVDSLDNHQIWSLPMTIKCPAK